LSPFEAKKIVAVRFFSFFLFYFMKRWQMIDNKLNEEIMSN